MKRPLGIRGGLVIIATIGSTVPTTAELFAQKRPIPPTSIDLTEDTYSEWRDFILPTADELRWQKIPWRRSWTEALGEAQMKNKPILVWAMNGHPLNDC